MPLLSDLGKLVFRTKQGSLLKLDRQGKLISEEGALVPYSAEEILDDASLATYNKFKSGDVGSVNEVLSLGTKAQGKPLEIEISPLTKLDVDRPPSTSTQSTQTPYKALDMDAILPSSSLTPNQQVQRALGEDLVAANGLFTSRDNMLGMLGNQVSPNVQAIAKGTMKGIGNFVSDPAVRSVAGLGLGTAAMTAPEDSQAAIVPGKIASKMQGLLASAPLSAPNTSNVSVRAVLPAAGFTVPASAEEKDKWAGVRDEVMPKAVPPSAPVIEINAGKGVNVISTGIIPQGALSSVPPKYQSVVGTEKDPASEAYARKYQPTLEQKELFVKAQEQYGVPAMLLHGIVSTESKFSPNAKNPHSTASGIAQLTKFHYSGESSFRVKFDPFDQGASIDYAAKLLHEGHRKFGSWEDAVKYFRMGEKSQWTGKAKDGSDNAATLKEYKYSVFGSMAGAEALNAKGSDVEVSGRPPKASLAQEALPPSQNSFTQAVPEQIDLASPKASLAQEALPPRQNSFTQAVPEQIDLASRILSARSSEELIANYGAVYNELVNAGKSKTQINEMLAPVREALDSVATTPGAFSRLVDTQFNSAPAAEVLFTSNMSPDTLKAAIEKLNQKPFMLTKTVGSIFSEDLAQEMAEYSDQLAGVVAEGLQKRGYETQLASDGVLEYKDKTTGEWLPVDSGVMSSIGQSVWAAKFEVAGGIGGAIAGAKAGAKAGAALPLPPQGKAIGTFVGGAAGGAAGVFAGNAADQYVAASILKEKLDYNRVVNAAAMAGLEDVVIGSTVHVLVKLGSAGSTLVMDAARKGVDAKNAWMLKGSLNEMRNITGVSKGEAETLALKVEDIAQQRIAGNVAQREVEAVLQTTPGMEVLVGEASRLSKTAGFGLLRSIDQRAKDFIKSVDNITSDNIGRVLIDDLNAYRAGVKATYDGIKQLGVSEADKAGFVYDPKTIGVAKMMDDAEAGITDPRRLARFDSFISRLAQIGQNSDKQFGLGELLETRRAINEFRSQGFGDYVATSRIDRVIANIDDQVVDATKVMPNGEAWLEQYRLANVEYAKMKTIEKNALYRALTAKGVTADKVVNELVTRIQSIDGTFMQVVGKLPMTTRNNVEGAVIRRLAENYSLGDASGYQAMDFPGLSVALKDVTFTTPAARDLKRVADKFASVYRNDPALSEAAGAVQLPKNTTYLATSIQSRVDMAIHNKLFNYVSRYLPTQEGRTRRLAESMANVLDNPTNAAAIDDLVKAMPGDPELQTELKQLAISYAERGQKETYPKVPVYKVYTKGYSLASSTTDLGSGIQYFTNKADATAAKQTGQVLEEVLVEPSRYATPQQVEVLVGKPFSLDVAKDPRTIQILQRHNFLGIAESKRVLEFK